MEKKFIQMQLGLFFKNDFQGIIENISLFLKEQFKGMTTQILGLPSNMPPELPRLTANLGSININLSKNRIDIFSTDKNFVDQNFEKILAILGNLSVEVGRVGVVTTSFKEISTSKFQELFDKTKIASLEPKEISVRFNEEIELEGFKANNSQMYVSGFVEENGSKKIGVIITRDINTLAEDLGKNNFETGLLEKYIKSALSKEEETII